MNVQRAISPWSVQPVNEAEVGIEPMFDIGAEIKRSAEAARAKGTLDNPDHPAFARAQS
jgi:hypothetical protein